MPVDIIIDDRAVPLSILVKLTPENITYVFQEKLDDAQIDEIKECPDKLKIEEFFEKYKIKYKLIEETSKDADIGANIPELPAETAQRDEVKFWQTIKEANIGNKGCLGVLRESELDFARRLEAQLGCFDVDEIMVATAILAKQGFIPIGWSGGNLRERGDFFSAGKGLVNFLDDVEYYLGMLNIHCLPLNKDIKPEALLETPAGNAISKGCEIAFCVKDNELVIYFKAKEIPSKIACKAIDILRLPKQLIENIKIASGEQSETRVKFEILLRGLDDDMKKQVAIILDSVICSSGGISYIGDWTGLYVARHIEQAIGYAAQCDEITGILPPDPVIHRIFMHKDDIRMHFKIVIDAALDTPESQMYMHQLQIESAQPGAVRGIYARETTGKGNINTGDETEIVLVGQGIPERVLCLPLNDNFTKRLIHTQSSLMPAYGLAADTRSLITLRKDSALKPLNELLPGAMGIYIANNSGILVVQEQVLPQHTGHGQAKGFSINQTPEDVVMRLVMRNPSRQVLESLYTIHTKIKEILSPFINKDDNASLNWLLEQTNEDSRGGFKDVRSLIAYLQADPKTISNSQLISQTATIVSSLAYCWIDCGEPKNADNMDEKDKYNMRKHEALLSALKPIILGHIVPHIGTVYPGRLDQRDILSKQVKSDFGDDKKEVVTGLTRQLSTASMEDEDEAIPPTNKAARSMYAKDYSYGDGNTETWPQKARNLSLPIRNHISSGLPLDLAVCEGLLGIEPIKWSPLNKKIMRDLATTMHIPHYGRADYHSWPETQAAIEYFTELRSGVPPKAWEPDVLMAQAEEGLISVVEDLTIKDEIIGKISEGRQRREKLISTQRVLATPHNSSQLEANKPCGEASPKPPPKNRNL